MPLTSITGKDIHAAYEHVVLERKKQYEEVSIPTPITRTWEECSPESRTLYEKMAEYLNTLKEQPHAH